MPILILETDVLAAATGLPVTGGNPLSLPMLILAVGFGLKLMEKYLGKDLKEKVLS
jgi:hypothetical protein